MTPFTEHELELAIIDLLKQQDYEHLRGEQILSRRSDVVLLADDLRSYLTQRYAAEGLTAEEISFIVRELEIVGIADLYAANRKIMNYVMNGYTLKRIDRSQKDFLVELIDWSDTDRNTYKFVNQLEIQTGDTPRIPDGILYVNGLPLVVFEFKSAVREDATLTDAHRQLTIRYRRDIPELFKYNALCVISDGVNTKMGSFFAPVEFYYAWRKVTGFENAEQQGIPSLYSMIRGLFDHKRLRDVLHHFIFFPDSSHKEEKIVCRYPQYYAATKLYHNILKTRQPYGDGRGGTYFGATGCGKSYAMLFLTRLLMKSQELGSPTIVLITDRTDLDDQLSEQFVEAKTFIGDAMIKSVESRNELKDYLQGRESGGVFLTTIHKFTESAGLLSDRQNIICISDEAHRSQINLDQKLVMTAQGVETRYGFAKWLHDSLPGATYVGFTGTPVDATLDVFGDVIDRYTMVESVDDDITVPIVYEGRAAKVILDEGKLREIEDYYEQAEAEGTNEYQIEASKRAVASMNVILSDPDILRTIAKDFISHYENRINEKATVAEKAMFVCPTRQIGYAVYKEIIALRPEWNVPIMAQDFDSLKESEKRELFPIERIKLVMTRGNDDEATLWDLLGSKKYRKQLDRQFKNDASNFKIAIVVDMWLTGFDVPSLDTMYVFKPLQKHTLIQTISRVNRKYDIKKKGLVIDYLGIKRKMNQALAQYGGLTGTRNFEEIQQSVTVVKDRLDILNKMFHAFDISKYFTGTPLERLQILNLGAEYVLKTNKFEQRFMEHCKRLRAAYDICAGDREAFTDHERDLTHFYFAIRSIIYKLTKGNAPDAEQMNRVVASMIHEALQSDGVEEILKIGDKSKETNIFNPAFLDKILKIKLPNTKIKLLQQLLAREIDDFKKVNKIQGIDFSKKFKALVDAYNDRTEQDILVSEVLEEFTDKIINLVDELKTEKQSFETMGIDYEEKAFYDILKYLTVKYEFEYPEDKLVVLARKVKSIVDDKMKYTAWDQRDDIKAELKADLIIALAEHKYPPVDRDEVYKEIFEQAENFKRRYKHREEWENVDLVSDNVVEYVRMKKNDD
ncbi:MAG: HsdR family type I site-specific deoxyribonuclease [Tannerella sp.]|jgi:type I restriction enzyme R subunit|nr:HsdR family type I site-specific deoxyribonuclease [Tannerella sp.]